MRQPSFRLRATALTAATAAQRHVTGCGFSAVSHAHTAAQLLTDEARLTEAGAHWRERKRCRLTPRAAPIYLFEPAPRREPRRRTRAVRSSTSGRRTVFPWRRTRRRRRSACAGLCRAREAVSSRLHVGLVPRDRAVRASRSWAEHAAAASGCRVNRRAAAHDCLLPALYRSQACHAQTTPARPTVRARARRLPRRTELNSLRATPGRRVIAAQFAPAMGCGASAPSAEETLLDAAELGNVRRLRAALDAGADVTAVPAVRAGPLRAADRLARCNAHTAPARFAPRRPVDAQSGVSALQLAVFENHEECVQLLLERGASVNSQLKVRHCCGASVYLSLSGTRCRPAFCTAPGAR